MNHKIINEPCKTIRAIARQALRDNWVKVAAGVAIYLLLTTGINALLDQFFYSEIDLQEIFGEMYRQAGIVNNVPIRGEIYKIGYASSLYSFLLNGPFTVGLTCFFMTFLRRRQAMYSYLFSGFDHFLKAFWLSFLMAIKIFLWSLLFVIPGIIAIYRYSQAYYILVDHPEFSANHCLRESSRIMAGNKGKLFCLELSFIGWTILANIVGGIVDYALYDTGVLYTVLAVLSYVPILFLDAYVFTAEAVFFDLLSGNLVPISEQEAYQRQNINDPQ